MTKPFCFENSLFDYSFPIEREEAVKRDIEIVRNMPDKSKAFVEFVRRKFHIEEFKTWQADFLEEICNDLIQSMNQEQYLAKYQLIGAYGVGKSYMLYIVVCCYMIFCFLVYPDDEFNGAVFSANEKQMKTLWRKSENIINKMPDKILVATGSKIMINPVYGGKSNIVFEWKTWGDTAGGVAGMHGKNVLAILDEATEIPQYVFEKAETYFTSCKGIWLVAGNPTNTNCEFYRNYASRKDPKDIKKGQDWENRRISRYQFEDVEGGNDNYANMIANRPENAPFNIDVRDPSSGDKCDSWRVNVLGKFPLSVADTIFPRVLLDRAVERHIGVPQRNDRYYFGVDVAAGIGRDYTVIIIRTDTQVIEIIRSNDQRVSDVFEKLIKLVIYYRPVAVCFDESGIGQGVVDMARANAAFKSVVIHGVNGCNKSDDPQRWQNVATQLYRALRDWLETLGGIPDNKFLLEELGAFVQPNDGRMRKAIYHIDKKLVIDAIGRSPDIADALAYSFAAGGGLIDNPDFLADYEAVHGKVRYF